MMRNRPRQAPGFTMEKFLAVCAQKHPHGLQPNGRNAGQLRGDRVNTTFKMSQKSVAVHMLIVTGALSSVHPL